MRCEWMLVLVFAAMLVVPVTADKIDYSFGPTTIEFEMETTLNESDSIDFREGIDGDGDWNVSQEELDNYTALMEGFLQPFEVNWTMDGAKNTSATVTFGFTGVVGEVNGTTLIVQTMAMSYTYSTTTADEHTIVFPYEGDGGDANDTEDVDFSMVTVNGWYFDSVSNSALTISEDGTELEVTSTGMASYTEDLTIVITNVAPAGEPDPEDPDDDDDDDDTPGFEMIAVVGAMAVALIAVRRRR